MTGDERVERVDVLVTPTRSTVGAAAAAGAPRSGPLRPPVRRPATRRQSFDSPDRPHVTHFTSCVSRNNHHVPCEVNDCRLLAPRRNVVTVRIMISADMEGATGVTWTEDVEPGTEQWQRFRAMFTGDVNAAVLGLHAGGATDVLVNEAHCSQRNLLLEDLDPRARMLTGRHKPLSMMQGIDSGVDGVVFLGYHAGAGVDGVLSHTYLPNSITGVWLDGVPASEGRLNAALAAEYGVPVLVVTGDDRTCADAADYAPDAHRVAVKECVSRYAAICSAPSRTAEWITSAASAAMKLAGRGDSRGGRAPRRDRVRRRPPRAGRRCRADRVPDRVRRVGFDARDHDRRYAGLQGGDSHRVRRDRGNLWLTHVADPARCAHLIRFDTTNRGGGDAEGERAAALFVAALLDSAGASPVLLERTPGRSNVVGRVAGRDPSLPAVLVQAHLDVVPADPVDWSVSPFSGEIRDGYVWGRGATDMKDMVAMVLTVLAGWAEGGRRPARDVVVAFVADEEDAGEDGADWLVAAHPSLFDGCAAAIGESGGFTHHADGVRFYPVATAERGTAHLRLTARGRAGHASRRNPDNPVVRLVSALDRLAGYRWPVRLTPAVRAFLEQATAALGTDLDLSDVDTTVAKLGAAAALVENTVRASTTPTVLRAGSKVNVVPSYAVAEVDVRVLPGIEDEVLGVVDSLLGDGIVREFIGRQEAVGAPMGGSWFGRMAAALVGQDGEGVVVPYCMGGGTDAKAFSRLGIDCYGFAPLWIPRGFDYRSMAHGVDERVPVAGLEFGVRVLDDFLSG